MTVTVHAIDPAVVESAIAAKIAYFEGMRPEQRRRCEQLKANYAAAVAKGTAHQWTQPPATLEEMMAVIDNQIAKERDEYSTVQILENTDLNPRQPFFLFYGGDQTRRTGGFESYDRALAWFTGQGR